MSLRQDHVASVELRLFAPRSRSSFGCDQGTWLVELEKIVGNDIVSANAGLVGEAKVGIFRAQPGRAGGVDGGSL